MSTRQQLQRLLGLGALMLALSAAVNAADAQGKNKAAKSDHANAAGPSTKSGGPPGQAKKKVTTSQALVASREILVRHGYSVVRVERVGLTQVIYYRRGNNGRGRGLGPMQKMVIVPRGDIVVFESAPKGVLVDLNIRFGL